MTDVLHERALLGGILLNPDAIYQCSVLKPEDFETFDHRRVFSAMREIAMVADVIDLVTLGAKLHKADDPSLISALLDGIPDRQNVDTYVRMVVDSSRRRALRRAGNAIVAQCDDPAESTADCMEVAASKILNIAADRESGDTVVVGDTLAAVHTSLTERAARPAGETMGLSTGIPTLDAYIGGIGDEYVIVGGYPNEGKTVLVAQIVVEAARRYLPVLWFSAEMNRRKVVLRMIPQLADGLVTGEMLRDPRKMGTVELQELDRTRGIMQDWPIFINDKVGMDGDTLYSHAMAMKERHGIVLIVADYLQRFRGKGDNTTERIANLTSMFGRLQKTLRIPVVVVSNLARNIEKAKRRPRIYDLKGSGDIEYDADVILMPFRPEDEQGAFTYKDEIIIGKHRDAQIGSVPVEFHNPTLTFKER